MPGTAPPTAGEGLAVWLAVKPFLDVLFKHILHERIHLRFNFASARSHLCMVHSAREGTPWARTVNFHTRKIAKASSSWKENFPIVYPNLFPLYEQWGLSQLTQL